MCKILKRAHGSDIVFYFIFFVTLMPQIVEMKLMDSMDFQSTSQNLKNTNKKTQ